MGRILRLTALVVLGAIGASYFFGGSNFLQFWHNQLVPVNTEPTLDDPHTQSVRHESVVVALDDKEFVRLLAKNKWAVIFFYTPRTLGFSAFAADFEKTAKELHETNPDIAWGRVNYAESHLAKARIRVDDNGIWLFKKSVPAYEIPPGKDDMTQTIIQATTPDILEINSEEEFNSLTHTFSSTCVAVVESENDSLLETFKNVSKRHGTAAGEIFAWTSPSSSLAEALHLQTASITLFRYFEEPHQVHCDLNTHKTAFQIGLWAGMYSLPTLAEVGYLNKNLYKTTWQPVGLLFIDADNPASAELKAAIEQLAVESRNEDDAAMIFGWTNVGNLKTLPAFPIPCFKIEDNISTNILSDNLTLESLRKFYGEWKTQWQTFMAELKKKTDEHQQNEQQ